MNLIIYSILILLIPIFMLVCARILKKPWIRMGYFVSAYFIYTFRYAVGRDYHRYLTIADMTVEFKPTLLNEPIQELLFYISYQVGMPKLYILLSSLLAIVLLYLVYHQYRDLKSIDILMAGLYLVPLIYIFTIPRNVIGVLLVINGMKILEKDKLLFKDLILFFGITVIALLNHMSLLLAFAFPMFRLFSKWQFRFKYTVMSLLAIFSVTYIIDILSVIVQKVETTPRYIYYFDSYERMFFKDSNWILFLILILIGLAFDGFYHPDYPLLISLAMTFMWLSLIITFLGNATLVRLSVVVVFAIPLLIAYIIHFGKLLKHPFRLRGLMGLSLGIFILFGAYFGFVVLDPLPYTSDTYLIIDTEMESKYLIELMEKTDLSLREYLKSGQ